MKSGLLLILLISYLSFYLIYYYFSVSARSTRCAGVNRFLTAFVGRYVIDACSSINADSVIVFTDVSSEFGVVLFDNARLWGIDNFTADIANVGIVSADVFSESSADLWPDASV